MAVPRVIIGCILSCLGLAVGRAASLDWVPGNGYRSAALAVPGSGKTGFTLMNSDRTGILFTNVLDRERSLTNQIYLNGSGVALGDVDAELLPVALKPLDMGRDEVDQQVTCRYHAG